MINNSTIVVIVVVGVVNDNVYASIDIHIGIIHGLTFN
jgi:hypothetical protein